MNYVPHRTPYTLTQPKTHTRNTKIHYNFYLTLVFVPSCTIKPKPEPEKTPPTQPHIEYCVVFGTMSYEVTPFCTLLYLFFMHTIKSKSISIKLSINYDTQNQVNI